MPDGDAARRTLPSVDRVLAASQPAIDRFGRPAVRDAVRDVLAEHRARGESADIETIASDAAKRLATRDRSSLRPVFNLTGTVLHTNLGRALLAEEAIAAATAAMRDAVALEFDLETGGRGERDDHVRELLCELTGAEDATLINNNAAAIMLALAAIGAGKESIVSRGELIEIGGAFRMPDIMARAGTRLREVGTTNRTHPRDYQEAIGPETALLLKVHTSNYRVQGFTAEVDGPTLAAIAHAAGLPFVNDLGSGTLLDLSRWGLQREPTVREAVAEGADLVTFSGDKLLGGPQAGFVVGRRDLIARLNRNPLKRAMRVDKIRLAAIEATLKLFRDPDRLAERLPTLRLLSRPRAAMDAQAAALLPRLRPLLPDGLAIETAPCSSQIGSGALPLDTLPSCALRLFAPSGRDLAPLAAGLRDLDRPVIGRLHDGAVLLDLRCLDDDDAFVANFAGLRDRLALA